MTNEELIARIKQLIANAEERMDTKDELEEVRHFGRWEALTLVLGNLENKNES